MDHDVHDSEAMPYPQVPNHIEDDPTPKDQAIYVPSVTPSFAKQVYAQRWKRNLPEGVADAELNFFDPNNKLFRISHAMTSAGQAMNQSGPCIINQRDRTKTLVIGDSGGYQIANGSMAIYSDSDRLNILRWLENNADVAMTLDVPTGPILKRGSGYRYATSADCLTATLEHLAFFQKHRQPGVVRFLNVLQGNNPAEADVWYDRVKVYDFEGWAFAGKLRNNFYHFCRRLLIMADEGMLQNRDWIHVLGTNELDTAVLLTVVQRAINRTINPNLRISYDTSTPFRNLAFNQLFTLPQFLTDKMTMGTRSAPNSSEFIGCKTPWPWPSPIGDKMVMGDYCVRGSRSSNGYTDALSNALLAHHNLGALCWGIATANRVFDAECIDHNHTIALPVGSAAEAIEKIFKTGKMATLRSYEATFSRLRHNDMFDSGDEYRLEP